MSEKKRFSVEPFSQKGSMEDEIKAKLEQARTDLEQIDKLPQPFPKTQGICEGRIDAYEISLKLVREHEATRNKQLQALQVAKQFKIKRALELGKPYIKEPTKFDYAFLIKRLKHEVTELEFQVINVHIPRASGMYAKWQEDAILEIADISNFLDFIYCKVQDINFQELLKP